MGGVTLGVIPARGGSKGIKDKNLCALGGMPLIAHTIRAARAAASLDAFLVSTDSEEIARVARDNDASVPFIRPSRLATDDAPTSAALQHAVAAFEEAGRGPVEAVVLLQPTTPLRTADDIDRAVALYRGHPGADSLISCYDALFAHPAIMYRIEDRVAVPLLSATKTPPRRQDMDAVYVRNGALYITRRRLLMEDGRIIGERPLAYVMPRARSINIDEPLDLVLAEALLGGLRDDPDGRVPGE